MYCCQFPGMEIKDPTDSRVKHELIILGGHSRLLSHSYALSVLGPFIKPLPTPQPLLCKSNNGTVLPEKCLLHMPAWSDPKLSHPFFCSHSDTLTMKNSPQGKRHQGQITPNTWVGVQDISGPIGRKDGMGTHLSSGVTRTGLSLWPDTERLWTHGKQA